MESTRVHSDDTDLAGAFPLKSRKEPSVIGFGGETEFIAQIGTLPRQYQTVWRWDIELYCTNEVHEIRHSVRSMEFCRLK